MAYWHREVHCADHTPWQEDLQSLYRGVTSCGIFGEVDTEAGVTSFGVFGEVDMEAGGALAT